MYRDQERVRKERGREVEGGQSEGDLRKDRLNSDNVSIRRDERQIASSRQRGGGGGESEQIAGCKPIAASRICGDEEGRTERRKGQEVDRDRGRGRYEGSERDPLEMLSAMATEDCSSVWFIVHHWARRRRGAGHRTGWLERAGARWSRP